MTLVCPKCKTPNETGGAAPGTAITCQCGNVLAVPKSGGLGAGWVVLIVVAVCAIPCIGILAAIAIPNFIKYQSRSKAMEARTNIRQLCTEERAYKEQNGKFLAAGPQPKQVPSGPKGWVQFPSDPDFEKLGFTAERVRYQYQVVISPDGESAKCIARGDLNGDGVNSEFVYDTATGETSVEREFE